MIDQPLYVAIVWHMHQPYYRDLLTGEIALPWVRMHAAKDYLHMGTLLAEYPKVHLTINMVPSLTEQMLAWAEGREQDELARLAEQTAWTATRSGHPEPGFSISWDNIIRRYPRYAELLDRRPAALADPALSRPATTAICLPGSTWPGSTPTGWNGTPTCERWWPTVATSPIDDLQLIHGKQRKIAGGVAAAVPQAGRERPARVSTSPFYHPILPLLIDTGSARRPSPALPLPELLLRAPEDAAAQLQIAVDAHTRHFGRPPRGCGLRKARFPSSSCHWRMRRASTGSPATRRSLAAALGGRSNGTAIS